MVDAAQALGDVPVVEFLEENGLSLAAAVSSFTISSFWLSHHRTSSDVDRCPPSLLRVNLLNVTGIWGCGQLLQTIVRRYEAPRDVSASERFGEWTR